MPKSTHSACLFKLLNTTAHKPSLSQTFTYSFSTVNLQVIDKLAIGITINTYVGNSAKAANLVLPLIIKPNDQCAMCNFV